MFEEKRHVCYYCKKKKYESLLVKWPGRGYHGKGPRSDTWVCSPSYEDCLDKLKEKY